MVGVKGLGDEARQAKWAPKGHSRRRAQARGHSAPYVGSSEPSSTGRRRRLPRNRNNEIKGFPQHGGKRCPCRDDGGGEIVRFFARLDLSTASATLIRRRHPMPSCGGLAPTAERTVDPARMIAESLTSHPGIREQNLPIADIAVRSAGDAAHVADYVCSRGIALSLQISIFSTDRSVIYLDATRSKNAPTGTKLRNLAARRP